MGFVIMWPDFDWPTPRDFSQRGALSSQSVNLESATSHDGGSMPEQQEKRFHVGDRVNFPGAILSGNRDDAPRRGRVTELRANDKVMIQPDGLSAKIEVPLSELWQEQELREPYVEPQRSG